MDNQLTEQEKKILSMFYRIGVTIIETNEEDLIIDNEWYSKDDLYNLMCKLGVEV